MKSPTVIICFFILLCGSCGTVVAQKNIVPAYIVTSSSDTVKGFINDKNWRKNPLSI